MPFSIFIPLGILLMIAGIVAYFIIKRQKKIWLTLSLLGVRIAISTLGMISLDLNSM